MNKPDHRKPLRPHYKGIEGKCNYCGETVYRGGEKTGEIVGRGSWHNDCLHPHLIEYDPKYAKTYLFKERGDKCEGCGVAKGYAWSYELDHKIPLIDGGGFGEENLQLLCYNCHKAKTAREATERARKRKGQISLFSEEA